MVTLPMAGEIKSNEMQVFELVSQDIEAGTVIQPTMQSQHRHLTPCTPLLGCERQAAHLEPELPWHFTSPLFRAITGKVQQVYVEVEACVRCASVTQAAVAAAA